jgi:hypothetical protein
VRHGVVQPACWGGVPLDELLEAVTNVPSRSRNQRAGPATAEPAFCGGPSARFEVTDLKPGPVVGTFGRRHDDRVEHRRQAVNGHDVIGEEVGVHCDERLAERQAVIIGG